MLLLKACFVVCLVGFAQPLPAELNIDLYQQFLKENADLTVDAFTDDYGGDLFATRPPVNLANISYTDSIHAHYYLADDGRTFLKLVMYNEPDVCTVLYRGWYTRLY